MAKIPNSSIARITYEVLPAAMTSGDDFKYASGFFVTCQKYGDVCVTCAHVANKAKGKLLYINNCPAKVLFNAGDEKGIDVALLSVSGELRNSGIHFHKLGLSSAVNFIYYSHGWSRVPEEPNTIEFSKVWGPRFDRASRTNAFAGAQSYVVWRLRNDRYDPTTNRSFSTKNFAPGWSGAPVFNVRAKLDEHRVIGVLSTVVEQEGKAVAVSIEGLDFLLPAEHQSDEGWFGRISESRLQRWAARLGLKVFAPPRNVIRFEGEREQQLYGLRFEEIMGQPPCPPIAEPPSPYD